MACRKLADSVAEHRKKSGLAAGVAVITLSMSSSMDTDKSGDVIQHCWKKTATARSSGK